MPATLPTNLVPSLPLETKKNPQTVTGLGIQKDLAGSESGLWGLLKWTHDLERISGVSWAATIAVAYPLLCRLAHTGNLYYCLPLVGHAHTDVCYFQHHAQAQLTHAAGIVLYEVDHFCTSIIR